MTRKTKGVIAIERKSRGTRRKTRITSISPEEKKNGHVRRESVRVDADTENNGTSH